MKYTKRILSLLLAGLLLIGMLAGCSMPKLTIGGTPKTVGTIGDWEITSGEYLAYMYLAFTEAYFQQGLYQYAQNGMDAWAQDLTYGEGDDAQKIKLEEFIRLSARQNLLTQAAIRQLMKENDIEWDKDKVKELEDSFASMNEEEFLSVGIGRDTMIGVYKDVSLNKDSLLLGLYGKGGEREVSEKDRKDYFDKNYLSYKMISMNLTGEDGKALSEKDKKGVLARLNVYLEDYNKDKNFESVMDTHTKYEMAKAEAEEKENKDDHEEDTAGKDKEEFKPSTDKDNRQNVDATNLDENLAKEIRKLKIGEAKVIEYKADGSTPTAALILRLDINDDAKLFTEVTDAIIRKMKTDELDKEIEELEKTIPVNLKKSAIKKCKPQPFEALMFQ